MSDGIWSRLLPAFAASGRVWGGLLPAFAAAVMLSACATGGGSVHYDPDAPEMMSFYTPRDDGRPLTSDELYAFKTLGDLDRNLSPEDARTVELHFKFFVHERRALFERFLTRSARFLPYVVGVFTSRGIPKDVSYLFMVESGGNPNAYSRASASGLWQFIPLTGRKFGLAQNAWVDERRDPYKATYAASDYLLKLYNDFDNWHLAVAAYNAGEGKIGRAVNGTGAKDFFDLCRLDEQLEERARLKPETRDYVPRLLAVAKIMRNLKRLGFEEPGPDAAWKLTPVSLPPGTNLAGLAKQLDLSWEEFTAINPAFRRTASPPTAASTAYVPPDKLTVAVNWAAGPEARAFAGWKEHTVKKGESFASIAKRYKVSADAVKSANGMTALPPAGSVVLIPSGKGGPAQSAAPALTASAGTKAQTGKSTVPAGGKNARPAAAGTPSAGSKAQAAASGTRAAGGKPQASASKPQAAGNKPARGRGGTVTVKAGDTLYSIAKAGKVSMKALMEANNMKPGTLLKIGRKLVIP
ncbi:MAG: LysM peptidoglycan-binding domain-containing protein [Desulfovibrio sp.]|nr:LysM peptidoglycan-binding domain-containing protein [Desulfovibrio sp.]